MKEARRSKDLAIAKSGKAFSIGATVCGFRRNYEVWQRPIFSVTSPKRNKYSTQSAAPTRGRKWRDITVSIALGFASFVAYEVYTSNKQNLSSVNPTTFSEYVLVRKQPLSKNSGIFTLSPTQPPSSSIYQKAWQQGIWSVEFKQPQLQIARAYTPLPPSLRPVADDDEDLRFLIRRDPEGEVSSYLHHLPEGAGIEVRGPNLEYRIPEDVEKILFLAGGTGIAPALQAAYSLLEARERTAGTKVHILWANRRREDCMGGVSDSSFEPRSHWWKTMLGWSNGSRTVNKVKDLEDTSHIVHELEALKAKHPSQVVVDYFVDEEGSFITRGVLSNLVAQRDPGSRILLSGPDGFISYLAGPKVWSSNEEAQGPIGGLMQHLGLKSIDIWKL